MALLEGDPDKNQTPLAKKVYAAFAEIKQEEEASSWTRGFDRSQCRR